MIKADPTPFSRIARHPHGRARYQFRIRMIRVAEAMLVGQLAELNDAAKQRLARSQSAGSSAPAKRAGRPPKPIARAST